MGILWEGIPIIISIIAFSAYAAAGTMQSCPFLVMQFSLPFSLALDAVQPLLNHR